jgi:8-oxo-dGTP diphosphatase
MEALYVVAAVIEDAGRFLLAQRPMSKSLGGYWEFPGGKVEKGETPAAALLRELVEELGAERATVGPQVGSRVHHFQGGAVLIDAYRVTCDQSTLRAIEHQQIGWFTPDEMQHLPLSPADTFLIPLLVR